MLCMCPRCDLAIDECQRCGEAWGMTDLDDEGVCEECRDREHGGDESEGA
jgi:hypothetical protein